MFSNQANSMIVLFKLFIVFTLSGVSLASQAEQAPELIIKPTKCVSLQQDQICYVNVEIVWRTATVGDYCVSSSMQNRPIQCWTTTQQGTLSQEIEMSKDVTYQLVDKEGENILATAVLPLAWVYKKEKFSHSSWRIF